MSLFSKGFIETPSDGDITISVEESVQEKDGIFSSQEEDGGEKQQEDSQNRGKAVFFYLFDYFYSPLFVSFLYLDYGTSTNYIRLRYG